MQPFLLSVLTVQAQGKLALNSHHSSEGWGRPQHAPLPNHRTSFYDIFIHAHAEDGMV
jgi:hypothetical protein